MDDEIKFNDLLFKALDHAIKSVKNGGPLIPFVMTPTQIHRFVAERLEESKEKGEEYLMTNAGPLMVLAYDGFITIDSIRNDAVFVKGIDRNRKKRILIAQRYMPVSSDKTFQTIGNPVLVDDSVID